MTANVASISRHLDQDSTARPARSALWTGRILSGLAVLFLAFDAALKLLALPAAVEGTARAPRSSALCCGPATSVAPSHRTCGWTIRCSHTLCFPCTWRPFSGSGSACATAACARSCPEPSETKERDRCRP